MPSRTFYGYAPDALHFDPASGHMWLASGIEPGRGRSRFEVSEDEARAVPKADETSVDGSQVTTVYGPEGAVIGEGPVEVQDVRHYQAALGDIFSVTVFGIGGRVMGYVPSQPVQAGESYARADFAEPPRDLCSHVQDKLVAQHAPRHKQGIACFGPGTMIATQNGEVPVEWLDTSDMVLTRDDGFQPILWVGRTQIRPSYFQRYPDEAPITIAPGTLGPNCPTHPLSVTGDHRVMLRAAEAEVMFCSTEVLAPAKAWADVGLAAQSTPRRMYTVTHILLATHHLIMAEGAWVESMFTGPETLRRLSAEDAETLKALMGDDLKMAQSARLCLNCKEAVALLAQLPASDRVADDPQRHARCA